MTMTGSLRTPPCRSTWPCPTTTAARSSRRLGHPDTCPRWGGDVLQRRRPAGLRRRQPRPSPGGRCSRRWPPPTAPATRWLHGCGLGWAGTSAGHSIGTWSGH